VIQQRGNLRPKEAEVNAGRGVVPRPSGSGSADTGADFALIESRLPA
jgi:hypothetical protein